jgi:hypothetical protein
MDLHCFTFRSESPRLGVELGSQRTPNPLNLLIGNCQWRSPGSDDANHTESRDHARTTQGSFRSGEIKPAENVCWK